MKVNLQKIHKNAQGLYKEIMSVATINFHKIHNNFDKKYDSGRMSVVTQADKIINKLLEDNLPKLLPNSLVIGEEDDNDEFSEYTWIVDPIDGTGNYQKGLDWWGTSISLWKADEPIYGALLFPRSVENMIYGFKNGGVFDSCDNKISLKLKSPYKPAFSIDLIDVKFRQHVLSSDWKIDLSYRATGSTIYDGYNLILGGYDFSIIYDLAPWDVGAVLVLTKELGYEIDFLGKRISMKDDNFLKYEHVVLIAKPDIYNEIVPTVKKLIKDYEMKK